MLDRAGYDEINGPVIDEFRARGGKAAGPEGVFEGKPLVLVHHTGAKSGTERIAPLMPLVDDGRIYVFATKGGSDTDPDWYRNVIANPGVTVELGNEKFAASTRVLEGAERDEIYAKQAAALPVFAEVQAKTRRVIPVVELVRN